MYRTVDLKRDYFFYIPLLSTTRGHSCKIQHKCIPHRSCRYHFFSNRVIHMWNSLPQHIVKVFKSLLSKHDLSNLCKLSHIDRQFIRAFVCHYLPHYYYYYFYYYYYYYYYCETNEFLFLVPGPKIVLGRRRRLLLFRP